MTHLLDVPYLISTYGYIGIFLVVLVESGIFFFLPGDSLLFTAGLLASVGQLDIWLVVVLTLAASIGGNLIGYWVGAHLVKLRKFRLVARLVKDEHMTAAHAFFESHGRKAIVLARFLPAVRTFTPWVAGTARMKWESFVRWSVLGAVIWTFSMTFAGYFLGRAFPGIEKYLTEAVILIAVISVLPGIVGWISHRRLRTK